MKYLHLFFAFVVTSTLVFGQGDRKDIGTGVLCFFWLGTSAVAQVLQPKK